jgi:hypothetical protein
LEGDHYNAVSFPCLEDVRTVFILEEEQPK